MDRCDEVVLSTRDGWERSEGVLVGVRIATELGEPVRYLAPEDADLGPRRGEIAGLTKTATNEKRHRRRGLADELVPFKRNVTMSRSRPRSGSAPNRLARPRRR